MTMRGFVGRAIALVVVALVTTAPMCGSGKKPRRSAGETRATSAPVPVLAFTRNYEEVTLLGNDWKTARFIGIGREPRWSPDGSRLLIHEKRRLSVYDLSTNEWRRVVRLDPADSPAAEWAPVGHMLAFTTVPRSFHVALSIVDARGGRAKRIVTWGGAGGDGMPFSWSPDGRRLAYALCEIVGPGSHGDFDCRIVVAGVDNRSRRRIVGRAVIEGLAWSPARAEIAFSGRLRSGPGEGEYVANINGVYVVQVPTGKLTRVVRGGVHSFAWSPNGRWIAYIPRIEVNFTPKPSGIALVTRDGQRRKLLVKPNGVGYGDDVEWSPDGNFLASTASYGDVGLRIIDVRTGRVIHKTTSATDGDPAWRPR